MYLCVCRLYTIDIALCFLSICRLSAIYGGTYMLDKPDCEIVYNETGTVVGVKDKEGAMAQCDAVVCDPSYAKDKCKTVGKVGTPVQLA